MLKLVAQISYISYSSILEKAIVDYIGYSSILEKAIVVNIGKIAAKALKLVPKRLKRKLVVGVVERLENEIVDKLNQILDDEALPLNVDELTIFDAESLDMELEFHFSFGDIDYASLIPLVSQYKIPVERPLEIIIDLLPQKTKDVIFSGIISAIDKKIINSLNKYAEEMGWKITFSGVEVRNVVG